MKTAAHRLLLGLLALCATSPLAASALTPLPCDALTAEAPDLKEGKEFKAGDTVNVEWKGTWYKSSILEVKDDKYKIHYDGWGPEWDEWVGPDRMRPFAGYQVGDIVSVEWKGTWYKAQILEIKGNKYKIHYDGYGSEWDEWVNPERVRNAGK